MSLNKLSLSVEKGVALGLRVGCAELKVGSVTFNGVDGDPGDSLVTDGAGTLSFGPSLQARSYGWIGFDGIAYFGPTIDSYPVWAIPTVAPNVSGFDPAFYSADANGLTALVSGKYEVVASIWMSQAAADPRLMFTVLVDAAYTAPNAAVTLSDSAGSNVLGFQVTETFDLTAGQQLSLGVSRGLGSSASTIVRWRLSAKKIE